MTPEELGRTLDQLECLRKWAEHVREYALQVALKGTTIPGWGIQIGGAKRRYRDEQAVIRKVKEMGMNPFEQVLKGIPAMEKMMGTHSFEKELGELIETPAGKAKLVRAEH